MSKKQKLRACWKYLVSKSRFHYRHANPEMRAKQWYLKAAYDMLSRKSGDCVNFACAFAAMADYIGYDAYVIYGRITAAHYVWAEHAWVKINDRYYDPEGKWQGFNLDCYGVKKNPISTKIDRKYLYK